jgi:hypothetical protein
MTKAYFWKILGNYHVEEEVQFMLDSDEWYRSNKNGFEVLSEKFEISDSLIHCPIPVISGTGSMCIGPTREFSPLIRFSIPEGTRWLRASAVFRCSNKEWDTWKMAQFRLHLMSGSEMVKSKVIRVFRALHDGETQQFYVDLEIPSDVAFDAGAIDVWNAGSDKYIAFDDLTVTAFPGDQ